MTGFRLFTPDEALDAARSALSAVAGQPVSVGEVRTLSRDDRRNILVRAVARVPGREPQPIVVKATRATGYDCSAPAFNYP